MMNIQQRLERAAKISATAQEKRAVKAATQVTIQKKVNGEANGHTGAGSKAWASRKQPYPSAWTLRVLPKDMTKPNPVWAAAKRSLFYEGRVPHRILSVGSMIAVARKPAPRGPELEWFEYVAVDAPGFRNFAYRAKHGHAIRRTKSFTMKLAQSYRTHNAPVEEPDAE